MFQVRIHGRGGQGVVTASELLAVAAFTGGRHAQAFPSFGSERTGAPVVAYCRIDAAPIRTREPILQPDALIVLDATLLHGGDILQGIGHQTQILVNSSKRFAEMADSVSPPHLVPAEDSDAGPRADAGISLVEHHARGLVVTVPATDLAREHLGRPVPNAALLGGFAALTGQVEIDAVCAALRDRFPPLIAERNADAARAAFEVVAAKLRHGDARGRAHATAD